MEANQERISMIGMLWVDIFIDSMNWKALDAYILTHVKNEHSADANCSKSLSQNCYVFLEAKVDFNRKSVCYNSADVAAKF